MTVVGRLEGLIQPDDLINQLTFIMDANQTYLVSERLERYRGSRETSYRFGWLTWGPTVMTSLSWATLKVMSVSVKTFMYFEINNSLLGHLFLEMSVKRKGSALKNIYHVI